MSDRATRTARPDRADRTAADGWTDSEDFEVGFTMAAPAKTAAGTRKPGK